MKLLSKFKDQYNNITYKTYETENGIKVLHLDNPATIDFDFALIFKAGSSFETKESVPKGTAHFLEHILLTPNSIFKTKEEIDRFEQGSKTRPAIFINAYTSHKNIYFTSYTNKEGYKRSLKRLESIFDFPRKKFSNRIEKERGIILAEKSRKPKKEKDPYLKGLEFLFKGITDEFSYDVLGEKEDIKSIRIEDLERYYKHRFVSGNCVLSIQSNGELDESIRKKIEEISQKIPEGKYDNFRKVELKNEFKVATFSDDRANGINISFMYFNKNNKKIDYKEHALKQITYKLLDWLAFDILREEMGLIYNFSILTISALSYNYDIKGFKFVTEKVNTSKTLDELYTFLFKKTQLFLKSQKGKEWFDDVISSYVFPRSVKFNSESAESASTNLLEDQDIFNMNKSVEEVKKINIEDVVKSVKMLINTPPHIWVEGDMTEREMLNLIKKSPFEKQFNLKK